MAQLREKGYRGNVKSQAAVKPENFVCGVCGFISGR